MFRTAMGKVNGAAKKIIIFLLHCFHYFISPVLGQHCRFYPSCSIYAQIAIKQYGIFRGGWLILKRVGKCHPWHAGGYDPVPEIQKTLQQ